MKRKTWAKRRAFNETQLVLPKGTYLKIRRFRVIYPQPIPTKWFGQDGRFFMLVFQMSEPSRPSMSYFCASVLLVTLRFGCTLNILLRSSISIVPLGVTSSPGKLKSRHRRVASSRKPFRDPKYKAPRRVQYMEPGQELLEFMRAPMMLAT